MFQHDCSSCVFLGTTDDHSGRPHDLYVCAKAPTAKNLGPSLISRYGNDGPEYLSMPWKLIVQADPKDLPDMFILAHDTVVRRIFAESSDEMRAKLEVYPREPATPMLLACLGSDLTYVLRSVRGASEARWAQVLGTLHFKAIDTGRGNVEVFLAGGAG